ncbi:MAG: hypothetical protein KDD11_12115 [Acidobacteria bacterium]|nr:hypothetical protein [Acidobacteriota bacterium]
MELIVTHGERQETVRIERTKGGYEVHVGATRYRVDAAEAGAGLHSLLLADDGVHPQYEVAVEPAGQGYQVEVGGYSPPSPAVDVADPLTHLARASKAAAGGSGKRQVTAYMPGRVVALLAAEGDEITAGQGVLVLEAMKMENEIAAESSGVLRRILVEVGANVEGGDPLFEIG